MPVILNGEKDGSVRNGGVEGGRRGGGPFISTVGLVVFFLRRAITLCAALG